MAAVVAAGFVPPHWPDALETPLAFAGSSVALVGAFVVLLAGRALGRSLTELPSPRRSGELVEHGPYGVVRHPIYSGGLLFFAGFSLFASVPALALTALLAAFWTRKADDEERRLATRFPAYEDYRRRVRWRFLPGVY